MSSARRPFTGERNLGTIKKWLVVMIPRMRECVQGMIIVGIDDRFSDCDDEIGKSKEKMERKRRMNGCETGGKLGAELGKVF